MVEDVAPDLPLSTRAKKKKRGWAKVSFSLRQLRGGGRAAARAEAAFQTTCEVGGGERTCCASEALERIDGSGIVLSAGGAASLERAFDGEIIESIERVLGDGSCRHGWAAKAFEP